MGAIRRKIIKAVCLAVCAAIAAFNYSAPMRAVRELPETVYGAFELDGGGIFSVRRSGEGSAAVASDLGDSLGRQAKSVFEISLFGRIPIRTVRAYNTQTGRVMPGGCVVGITMHTDGLLVVGLGSFISSGVRACPAETARLRAGDILVSVNGTPLDSTNAFSDALSAGGSMELGFKRDGELKSTVLIPALEDGTDEYRAGMWIRESTVGIGTLSYYSMEDGGFGALGHAVTDIDTGVTLEIRDGTVVSADVIGVVAGVQGTPGELRGTFGPYSKEIGDITSNTELGVFGMMSFDWVNPLYPDGVEIAASDEVRTGAASLLTTVDGGGVKEYSIEIIKISTDGPAQKNMVVKVTDSELIALTGGIVQGMSGSPIIQDGRLIGAITHVLVNDPTRGYGIGISAMSSAAEGAG